MRRIVPRIQINRDPLDLALKPPPMLADDRRGQRDPHAAMFRPIHRFLKARERRQRGQFLAPHRIATVLEFLDRVASEAARIIGVRIAAGNPIEPLAHRIPDRVANLTRLASICNRPDQRFGQPQLPVARLHKDHSTVGGDMLLAEQRHYWAAP